MMLLCSMASEQLRVDRGEGPLACIARLFVPVIA